MNRKELILALLDAGTTIKEIKDQTGVSRQYIHQLMDEKKKELTPLEKAGYRIYYGKLQDLKTKTRYKLDYLDTTGLENNPEKWINENWEELQKRRIK